MMSADATLFVCAPCGILSVPCACVDEMSGHAYSMQIQGRRERAGLRERRGAVGAQRRARRTAKHPLSLPVRSRDYEKTSMNASARDAIQ